MARAGLTGSTGGARVCIVVSFLGRRLRQRRGSHLGGCPSPCKGPLRSLVYRIQLVIFKLFIINFHITKKYRILQPPLVIACPCHAKTHRIAGSDNERYVTLGGLGGAPK